MTRRRAVAYTLAGAAVPGIAAALIALGVVDRRWLRHLERIDPR